MGKPCIPAMQEAILMVNLLSSLQITVMQGLLNVLNLGIFHLLSSNVATMILKLALNKLQLDALEPYKVDGIVLAGYMRIVGTPPD